MPTSSVVVNDDLVLRVGRNKAPLSPSQAFTLAEQLIRARPAPSSSRRPTAPRCSIPFALATGAHDEHHVPEGSAYSASRRMWRRRDVGEEPSLSTMLTLILPYRT